MKAKSQNFVLYDIDEDDLCMLVVAMKYYIHHDFCDAPLKARYNIMINLLESLIK